MEKEEALRLYLSLAREHGKCASMHWHTDLLIYLIETLKPKVIVDLGTYCGGSFWCWLYGLIKANIAGHVYTVDIVYRGDKLAAAEPYKFLFTVITADGKSAEIPASFIDFLFIDDDHTYEQVMAEWQRYEPIVSIGGLIFFHDSISTYPEPNGQPCGVSKAIAELWTKHGNRFIRLVDHGAIINGDPCGLEIWIKLR